MGGLSSAGGFLSGFFGSVGPRLEEKHQQQLALDTQKKKGEFDTYWGSMQRAATRLTELKGKDKLTDEEAKEAQSLAQQYAWSEQQLNKLKERLQELIEYRTEYQQKYMQAINNSMGSTAIQEYRCFLSKLDRAIEQQYQLIAGGEQKVSNSRQHWMQKRTRMKAIDTLVEKIQTQERCQDDRREQQESDERSLFARRLTHLKSF